MTWPRRRSSPRHYVNSLLFMRLDKPSQDSNPLASRWSKLRSYMVGVLRGFSESIIRVKKYPTWGS